MGSDDSTAAESMGGQGMKGFLSVAYAKPHPELHRELFVKLPFPYAPANERMKNSYTNCIDEPEILFNRIMGPMLPFRIPKYYFGEFSYESSNYILISEKLPFSEKSWAEGGQHMKFAPFELQPHVQKFKDHLMPQRGFEHWLAIFQMAARGVASYAKGDWGPHDLLQELFPWSVPEACTGIGWETFLGWATNWPADVSFTESVQAENDENVKFMEAQVSLVMDFVRSCPNLFPKELTADAFLKSWFKEVMEMASYGWERNAYCCVDPEFIVFGHPNLCSDNAWFWRDEDGRLNCGILDWGAAMYQCLGSMIANCLGQADYEMLTEHERDLIRGFADTARECGASEALTFDTLYTMVKLQQANVGATMIIQLYKMQKKEVWATYKNRWVPEVYDRFLPRNYVGGLLHMLATFKYRGVFSAFQEWRRKNQFWFPPKKPFTSPAFP